MMTQPASLSAASLSAPSRSELVGFGALLCSFACVIRDALVAACSWKAQPSRLPPRELRYPMSGRAKRLSRSDD